VPKLRKELNQRRALLLFLRDEPCRPDEKAWKCGAQEALKHENCGNFSGKIKNKIKFSGKTKIFSKRAENFCRRENFEWKIFSGKI